jgi:hypothetical protein
VGSGVFVAVGVLDGVRVGVEVDVEDGVNEAVAVNVFVGVNDGVAVLVDVGVKDKATIACKARAVRATEVVVPLTFGVEEGVCVGGTV